MKKWLGIEGIKLELRIPEVVSARAGVVEGVIVLQSLHTQHITSISLAFVERYNRGRGQERLSDEYELGSLRLNRKITVPAGEIVEVPFALPFQLVPSEMEEIGNKNPLYGGLVKVAKLLHKVESEYRVEAEAKVEGTALNPFDKKPIQVK